MIGPFAVTRILSAAVILAVSLSCSSARSASPPRPTPAPQSASADGSPPLDRQALAAEVRAEIEHAWGGYARHAWGHDELRPLSRKAHDWHASTLYMTAVDSLDTLLLVGLKDEAA